MRPLFASGRLGGRLGSVARVAGEFYGASGRGACDDPNMSGDDLRAHLRGLGATVAQVEGLGDDDLIGLAGDLQLADGLDLDLEQLAVTVGCTPEEARAVYGLLGLPVEQLAGFGDGDVAMMSALIGDTSGLAEQVGPSLLRVAGTAAARMANTAVAAYVQDIEPAASRQMSPIALADQNAVGSALALTFAGCLPTVFRHHMWMAVRRQRRAQFGVSQPEIMRMAIGFVDLVGFTSLSRFTSPGELLATVESFERQAFDTAQRFGGRIVKSIGDEVMLAAEDATSVAAIALELVRARGDGGTVLARAGVTAGEVLFRLGDYYGPVVNLAARLADVAVPDEVLADRATAESPGVTAAASGRRLVKGFSDPVDVWTINSAEAP